MGDQGEPADAWSEATGGAIQAVTCQYCDGRTVSTHLNPSDNATCTSCRRQRQRDKEGASRG